MYYTGKFSGYSREQLREYCENYLKEAHSGYVHNQQENIDAYEAMYELQRQADEQLRSMEEMVSELKGDVDVLRDNAVINRAARKFVHINGLDDELERYLFNSLDEVIAQIQRSTFRVLN